MPFWRKLDRIPKKPSPLNEELLTFVNEKVVFAAIACIRIHILPNSFKCFAVSISLKDQLINLLKWSANELNSGIFLHNARTPKIVLKNWAQFHSLSLSHFRSVSLKNCVRVMSFIWTLIIMSFWIEYKKYCWNIARNICIPFGNARMFGSEMDIEIFTRIQLVALSSASR